MPLDEDPGSPVAWRSTVSATLQRIAAAGILALAGCGPTVQPETTEPSNVTPPPRPPTTPTANPGRQWLIGEMCPQGAAGRPGVAPLFLRGVGWSDEPGQVGAPLARGATGPFAVLGVDGKRAGVFSVVGVADVGLAVDVAVGSYAGAGPCVRGDGKADDPACVQALAGCGLAIAAIEPGQGSFGDSEAIVPVVGAACVAGDALAVDIDGDGAVETYPLAQLLDPVRAPADELTAAPAAAQACRGSYAQLGIRLTPGVEAGARVEQRFVVDVDVIGVVDVDGDGRRELFLAYRYPEGQGRTIAVYSATSSVARLERVGASEPWQR
jgi:hypothetical protein